MKRHLRVLGWYFVFFSVLMIVSACAKNPSETDARKVFENTIRTRFDNTVIEIVSFKKVNAQTREDSGVKIYVVEYAAEMRYPNGLNANMKHCLDTSRFQGWDCYMFMLTDGRVRDKGQIEGVGGEIIFEKTEKGWRDTRFGNIY